MKMLKWLNAINVNDKSVHTNELSHIFIKTALIIRLIHLKLCGQVSKEFKEVTETSSGDQPVICCLSGVCVCVCSTHRIHGDLLNFLLDEVKLLSVYRDTQEFLRHERSAGNSTSGPLQMGGCSALKGQACDPWLRGHVNKALWQPMRRKRMSAFKALCATHFLRQA